ncbi:MAG: hypothetical protein D6723_13080 [Acidobacteria bacterium]|nr:MAG: hypothetical protein D6723_13080 [Acidobacteriota bacterium]
MKQRIITSALLLGLAGMVVVSVADDQRGPGQHRFNIERFDRDGDGKLSRREFPGPPRLFDRLDVDGDGFISKAEVERFRHRAARSSFGERLLRVLDADHDGKLTREEFARIVEYFGQLDRDGDGMLTSQELRALAFIRQPPGRINVAALIERYDADGDGKLSRSELEAAPQFNNPRFFTMLDENGDGFVTSDELRTFVERHQTAHPR